MTKLLEQGERDYAFENYSFFFKLHFEAICAKIEAICTFIQQLIHFIPCKSDSRTIIIADMRGLSF